MYFFDPRQGRRRRHVLRDRSLALVRRSSRLGVRKAKFAGGHARGAVAASRRLFGKPPAPTDDQTIVQRIRKRCVPRGRHVDPEGIESNRAPR